jgi:hypothetical protein
MFALKPAAQTTPIDNPTPAIICQVTQAASPDFNVCNPTRTTVC